MLLMQESVGFSPDLDGDSGYFRQSSVLELTCTRGYKPRSLLVDGRIWNRHYRRLSTYDDVSLQLKYAAVTITESPLPGFPSQRHSAASAIFCGGLYISLPIENGTVGSM